MPDSEDPSARVEVSRDQRNDFKEVLDSFEVKKKDQLLINLLSLTILTSTLVFENLTALPIKFLKP